MIARLSTSLALALWAGSAFAAACDYRPSALISQGVSTLGSAVPDTDRLVELGKSAGYYTLVHGGSGAGTGLLAGTGGVLGSIGAWIMSPVAITAGSIAAVGLGAFEGICLTQVERVTDPYEVRRIVESAAAHDLDMQIQPSPDGDVLALRIDGRTETYLLRTLYIADWQLKARRALRDETLGPIFYGETEAETTPADADVLEAAIEAIRQSDAD